jgi:hypothetical protein
VVRTAGVFPSRPVFKKNADPAHCKYTDPNKGGIKSECAEPDARVPVNTTQVHGHERKRKTKAYHDNQKSAAPEKNLYGLKHTHVFLEKIQQ